MVLYCESSNCRAGIERDLLRLRKHVMEIKPVLILAPGKQTKMRAPAGQIWAYAMVTLSLLSAIGCGEGGPARAAVQGTVTWKGLPIENGKISFIPQNGGPEAIATIVNGKYQLPESEGPAIGSNRISIMGLRILGPQEAGPPHPPGTMIEATEQYIPNEYNNSSTLSTEIQVGENTHDLALPKS